MRESGEGRREQQSQPISPGLTRNPSCAEKVLTKEIDPRVKPDWWSNATRRPTPASWPSSRALSPCSG